MKCLLTVLLLGGAVLARADEIEPAVDTSSVAPAPTTTEPAPASEPARTTTTAAPAATPAPPASPAPKGTAAAKTPAGQNPARATRSRWIRRKSRQ